MTKLKLVFKCGFLISQQGTRHLMSHSLSIPKPVGFGGAAFSKDIEGARHLFFEQVHHESVSLKSTTGKYPHLSLRACIKTTLRLCSFAVTEIHSHHKQLLEDWQFNVALRIDERFQTFVWGAVFKGQCFTVHIRLPNHTPPTSTQAFLYNVIVSVGVDVCMYCYVFNYLSISTNI